MAEDLSDAFKEIRSLKRRIERMESGSSQESMSVDRGRMRIGDGEFLVDGDGLFRLVGTFEQTGVYNLLDRGSFNVESGGDVNVNDGGDLNVNDGGDLVVGQGGTVTVEGAVPITMYSETVQGAKTARITAGSGQIVGYRVGSASGLAFGSKPLGDSILAALSQGLVLEAPLLESGESARAVVVNSDGYIRLAPRGTGGGGGGEDLGRFQWPFSLSLVTSEYGPRDTGFHEGIDFAGGAASLGNPIPCAGDGTVADSVILHAGWGNYVRVVHTLSSGSQVSTLYAHMNQPPSVQVGDAVTKGQTLGYVGNTGNSFGAHLHFETWAGTTFGSHMNPRNFMDQYGPE